MPTVGTRRITPLPANGDQLAKMVAQEVELSLRKYFKNHLAYPNAVVKLQWSARFYCTPFQFQDSVLVAIRAEGEAGSESNLIQDGVEDQMEMDSIEIGIQSGTSPALVNPGLPTSTLPPPANESKGRRDLSARKGVGIEFMGGQPVNPQLGQDGAMRSEVAKVLADVEVGDSEPLHENTIIVPDGKAKGDIDVTTK